MLLAGLGRASLRKVATDAEGALKPRALAQAIEADRADGATPIAVVATLGATGSGGVDPLRAMGEICRRERVWLHVDAAWAGSALILEDQRWMSDGIEHADSFVFNPHKWLCTNFDCSAYFVRDTDALTRTFGIEAAYLKTKAGDRVIDYRDWGIPLGRRFRALKLLFVIRSYGVEGLKAMVANHIAWAQALADEIDAAPDFDLLVPCRLALINFRYHPPGEDDPDALDALNLALLQRLNDGGRLYLTPNRLKGAQSLRFSVGQTTTTRDHLQRAWQEIQRTARDLNLLGTVY